MFILFFLKKDVCSFDTNLNYNEMFVKILHFSIFKYFEKVPICFALENKTYNFYKQRVRNEILKAKNQKFTFINKELSFKIKEKDMKLKREQEINFQKQRKIN